MGYQSSDTNMENVYYVHKVSPWSQIDVAAIVTAFTNWETSNAAAQRGAYVELVRVTATDLTSLSGVRIDDQLVAPIPGTRSSTPLPANVTFAVKANIGKRGRGTNGRTYWIGLTEGQILDDQMQAAAAGLIVTALETLISDISGAVAGSALGVIHQFINRIWQPNAPFDPIVNYAYTDLNLDSQRDRLPGHKRHRKPATT